MTSRGLISLIPAIAAIACGPAISAGDGDGGSGSTGGDSDGASGSAPDGTTTGGDTSDAPGVTSTADDPGSADLCESNEECGPARVCLGGVCTEKQCETDEHCGDQAMCDWGRCSWIQEVVDCDPSLSHQRVAVALGDPAADEALDLVVRDVTGDEVHDVLVVRKDANDLGQLVGGPSVATSQVVSIPIGVPDPAAVVVVDITRDGVMDVLVADAESGRVRAAWGEEGGGLDVFHWATPEGEPVLDIETVDCGYLKVLSADHYCVTYRHSGGANLGWSEKGGCNPEKLGEPRSGATGCAQLHVEISERWLSVAEPVWLYDSWGATNGRTYINASAQHELVSIQLAGDASVVSTRWIRQTDALIVTAAPTVVMDAQAVDVEWGDVNGDDVPDVLVLHDGGLSMFTRLADRTYDCRVHYDLPIARTLVAAGDIDADGRADVVLGGGGPGLDILLSSQ